jgi:hypothetical protein
VVGVTTLVMEDLLVTLHLALRTMHDRSNFTLLDGGKPVASGCVCVSPNLSTKTRNSENNGTQRLLTKGGKGRGMASEARTVLVTGGAQGIGFGIAE